MKLVYVITRSDLIGGAQVHVRDLARTMQELGHSVNVLVGGEGPFTEELRRLGIPFLSLRYLVRDVEPLRDLRAFLELRSVLSVLKPDLVSAHSTKAGILARLAARSLGLRVIFTAHGWAFAEGVATTQRMMYALAERVAAMFCDRIITVSEHDRSLALKYRLVPKDKVVVVHNGMPDVQPTMRSRPEAEPVRIIMVARFEPQKDHITLLRAVAGLRHLGWVLEFVGSGAQVEAAREAVARLGLTDRVCFLGARRDVAERLAMAQIFVLVSRWEGLPRSILEAMRAGLPVVASDVGGVREAVVDRVTGFLVPRGDHETLRLVLYKLIREPSLRKKMGEAGRRRYEEMFTFEKMVAKTLRVYESVMGESLGGS